MLFEFEKYMSVAIFPRLLLNFAKICCSIITYIISDITKALLYKRRPRPGWFVYKHEGWKIEKNLRVLSYHNSWCFIIVWHVRIHMVFFWAILYTCQDWLCQRFQAANYYIYSHLDTIVVSCFFSRRCCFRFEKYFDSYGI